MPRFNWKMSAGVFGLATALLATMASQCGSPATPTPGPTSVPTAVVTAMPVPTDVTANVSMLQQTMGSVATTVQGFQGSAQSLTTAQQTTLAPQTSIFLYQLANLCSDLQPALSASTGTGQEQVASLVSQMNTTVQEMATTVALPTATPTIGTPGATETAVPTEVPMETGTPGPTSTPSPTSTPTASEELTTIASKIQTVADQVRPNTVGQLASPLATLVSQVNQLVSALAPTLQTLTPAQTYTLDLDATDLQTSAQGMVASLSGATPVATPTP
jgi:hypothetical protein